MNTAFYSYKGGQGVTTTAVLYATDAERIGKRVLIVDHTRSGDAAATMGVSVPWGYGKNDEPDHPIMVNDNLFLATYTSDFNPDEYDEIVHDFGVLDPDKDYAKTFYAYRIPAWHQVFVTRSCYLSLRKYAACNHGGVGQIVLIKELGRALTAHDVSRCCDNAPVVEINHDPRVSRMVDAGLLGYKNIGIKLYERINTVNAVR